MICCVADGAVAQVVVPFGLAKAGLLSGSPVVRVLVLGIQAASNIITVRYPIISMHLLKVCYSRRYYSVSAFLQFVIIFVYRYTKVPVYLLYRFLEIDGEKLRTGYVRGYP